MSDSNNRSCCSSDVLRGGRQAQYKCHRVDPWLVEGSWSAHVPYLCDGQPVPGFEVFVEVSYELIEYECSAKATVDCPNPCTTIDLWYEIVNESSGYIVPILPVVCTTSGPDLTDFYDFLDSTYGTGTCDVCI